MNVFIILDNNNVFTPYDFMLTWFLESLYAMINDEKPRAQQPQVS
jgi:hypothetical protein